jgi:asparagine synthase (glutamine-hydrolysing)
MCGIAGWADLRKQTPKISLRSEVSHMNDSLKHRGPNAEGVWADEHLGIALAHRRLAILDLTESGAQPMLSPGERFALTFNGEIYNFQILKKELLKLGFEFRGTSDTEVLLRAIEAWGVEQTLPKLEGMFAFAVLDRKTERLTLARDRLGEKPLAYCTDGHYFWFASEVRAFPRSKTWRERFGAIDSSVLDYFLSFGNIPAPSTIYKNVFKLMPGTFLEISLSEASELKPKAYYDVLDSVKSGQVSPSLLSDHAATNALENLLSETVRDQMRVDVPYGAFLSGGIDSSTIVALMQKNSSKPLNTFSIGFEDADFNEASHASAVAKYLKTNHHELIASPEQALGIVPELAKIYDEPFGDSSQIATYLVAKLAREEVTVCLSGDGGDELFAGYNRHTEGPKWWSRVEHLPLSVRAQFGTWIANISPGQSRVTLGLIRMLIPRLRTIPQLETKLRKLGILFQAKSEQELYYLLQSNFAKTTLPVHEDLLFITDRVPRQQYLDLITYLPNDILVKVDRATMAVSLESRMPFLATSVVDFAWSLPLSQKIRSGKGKWLLRQVLDRHVPAAMIDRPKAGFAVPISLWLRGPLRDWGQTLIAKSQFQWAKNSWSAHQSGKADHGSLLWNVLMLEAWLEESGAR